MSADTGLLALIDALTTKGVLDLAEWERLTVETKGALTEGELAEIQRRRAEAEPTEAEPLRAKHVQKGRRK